MRLRVSSPADLGAGLLFGFIAAFFLLADQSLEMGSVSSMGPGYLPTFIASGLGMLALVLTFKSFRVSGDHLPEFHPRPLVMSVAAVILFGALLHPLGLVFTAMLTVIVAAAAEKRSDWKKVMGLAAFLSAMSSLIFVIALDLPLPLWPGFLS